MWATIKITQAELDDMPIAASLEEAMMNDVPTCWYKDNTPFICREKQPHLVEIVEPIEEPQAYKPVSKTLYSLSKLQSFRQSWVKAKAAGPKLNMTMIDEAVIAAKTDHAKRCDTAIDYFSQQIRMRLEAPAVRSSLPKKKQRELGMLPPVK